MNNIHKFFIGRAEEEKKNNTRIRFFTFFGILWVLGFFSLTVSTTFQTRVASVRWGSGDALAP